MKVNVDVGECRSAKPHSDPHAEEIDVSFEALGPKDTPIGQGQLVAVWSQGEVTIRKSALDQLRTQLAPDVLREVEIVVREAVREFKRGRPGELKLVTVRAAQATESLRAGSFGYELHGKLVDEGSTIEVEVNGAWLRGAMHYGEEIGDPPELRQPNGRVEHLGKDSRARWPTT